MTGWIFLAVWAAGFVIAARKIAYALIADDERDGKPSDWGDRAALRFFGVLAGLVWPLILVAAVVTGKLPKTSVQLRAEREKLAREIAELEAENERLQQQQEGRPT